MEQIEQNNLLNNLLAKGLLYIKEQNLKLVIKDFSLYSKKDNMFVIIGNEMKYSHGINRGDLMTGIIKFETIQESDETKHLVKVVLPFSKRLLYANLLDDNSILLVYVENKHLRNKRINLQEDGSLLPEDYSFLFEDEVIVKESRLKRSLAKFKIV